MTCSVCGSDSELVKGKKQCKVCKARYQRKYYLKNKRYFIDKGLDQKQKIRSFIYSLKEKNPCVDCGVSYPYYVMDFDHKYDKNFNVSQMTSRYGKEKLLEEIAKCDIVCANCHRERTYSKYKRIL